MSPDCRLTVTVRPARGPEEVAAAQQLRIRVFCDEQGVPRSEELDEHESACAHLVALDESGVIGTCRLRPDGPDLRLERMVVDRRLRGSGVGARILAEAESVARESGAGRMVLNAQTRAVGFYEGSGYAPEGGTFMDAGIEHIRMTKAMAAEAGP